MKKEDIIRMAIEAGSKFDLGEPHPDMVEVLERFFHMAQAAEREACAKVCEEIASDYNPHRGFSALGAKDCATAIRARNNQ